MNILEHQVMGHVSSPEENVDGVCGVVVPNTAEVNAESKVMRLRWKSNIFWNSCKNKFNSKLKKH